MIRLHGKIRPTSKPTVIEVELKNWEIDQLKQLENKEYLIEIKEIKSKRSLQQNSLMWELINKINLKINGFTATKETEEVIYTQLIELAQIKREYVATVESALPTLQGVFRVVKNLGKVRTEQGIELTRYALYKGSSHFNTEEMSRFIDALMLYAERSGVDTSEYN